MKTLQIISIPIIILSNVLDGFAQDNCSIIKGKVVNWPTDTVYMQTMPFYSPHSSEIQYQVLSKDSIFKFEVKNSLIPSIIQLYPNKQRLELNRKELLFLNYTKNYFYGHCIKFYTYGVSTFLIEPNQMLNIKLISSRNKVQLSTEMAQKYRKAGATVHNDNTVEQIKKTKIFFLDENANQYNYFQKSFDLEDKVDKRLELYENRSIEKAAISFIKIRDKLLNNLESEKKNLSALYYEYLKAEIEFGARVEFIKYIMFINSEVKKAPECFFSQKLTVDIKEIIEFDKDSIAPVVMASEAYNKYLELYLNFKINLYNQEFSAYNKFSKQKCIIAIQELPKQSAYYYIAGQLLQTYQTAEFVEELIIESINTFPDGDLNGKLMEKYDL